jgi:Na+/H+-dicarboxylate symporter/ABC-type amino acid transport substrate-binding protein
MKLMRLRYRPSLSTCIVISLGLGILCGLFFGESCAWLKIIGDVFIRLLQMSILPYIVVSLILGFGSLSYTNAKRLAVKGCMILVLFWSIALGWIMLVPVMFPSMKTGSFFSTSSVKPAESVNYVELYVPINPFESLANGVIPAVVLFCIGLGIVLLGMKNKEPLLTVLRPLSDALTKLSYAVVKITPIGVFALAANAAGTMTISEFDRLQVYFVVTILSSLILAFAVFPLLIAMLTPFKYRDILVLSRDVLITAFTTSNLFIVMPTIIERSKMLFDKYDMRSEESDSLMDVVVPIYFNFPNSGKLLSLVFIPFAAWFVGSSLQISQYPEFALTGFCSFFGSVNMALPYLLKNFQLSADLFQLYLIAGVLLGQFLTMLATMDLIAFNLLTVSSLMGKVRFKMARFGVYFGMMATIAVLLLVAAKVVLATTYKSKYTKNTILENMSVKDQVASKVNTNIQSTGYIKDVFSKLPTLSRILERKVIRIGYNPDQLPFTYINGKGEVAGYDAAMANLLASELGCKLEYYPIDYKKINEQLDAGNIDIVMSGVTVSISRLKKMEFTDSYMTLTPALMVKSYKRSEFGNFSALKARSSLTVASVDRAYAEALKARCPEVKIVILKTNKDFFEKKHNYDALLISAEAGSAWTLKYPDYSVVVPRPMLTRQAVAYAVSKNNPELLLFLNQWLQITKINGGMEKEYEYWILGQDESAKKRRWSIAHDLLGWNI